MSSRERMLCALHHQEPDHVPLYNVWTTNYLPYRWGDQFQRIPEVLALGLDDIAHLHIPRYHSPDVWTRCWTEWPEGSRYAVLVKEYHTPKGVLRQRAKRSEDWVHGEDIPITSFQYMAQGLEYPIKNSADLEKLAYLFPGLTDDQIADFHEQARDVHRFAQRHGVLVLGSVNGPADAAAYLFGHESLALNITDDPGLVEEVLAFFAQRSLRQEELLLDVGVDLFRYGAYSEMPDFWSVAPYHRFIVPYLRQHITLAHQAGVLFSYWLDKGVMARRQDLLDLEIDSLEGVDPIQDTADIAVLKRKVGHRICLWGGLNGAITIAHGSRQEIRDAVTEAVRILAPGSGFVLWPVDQIYDDAPWENVMDMVERWREIGEYPLKLGQDE